MLIVRVFVLINLFVSIFKNTPSYSLNDSNELDDNTAFKLKITLSNKDCINHCCLGTLIKLYRELTEDSIAYTLYMPVPKIGQSHSQFYTGVYKHLKFTFTKDGFFWRRVKQSSTKRLAPSIRHIAIYYSMNINYWDFFLLPSYNVRCIDNEDFVESLKLLAAKAVNKFRGHQITEKQIKDQLPIELQEYLEEND